MERIRQELLLKKILVIKELWENKGRAEGPSLLQMREILSQSIIKFEGRTETRFAEGIKFLEIVVSKCE